MDCAISNDFTLSYNMVINVLALQKFRIGSMRRTIFILALLLMLAPVAAMAAVPSSGVPPTGDVSGYWYTEGHEGVVQLYHCADKICGRFQWIDVANPRNSSFDSRNPDPTKRERPLCRMQFMGDFMPDGAGHYIDGWIYSPRHGATFNAEMKLLDPNTLSLHGYLALPLFGMDQTWTRVAGSPSSCTSNS
jgi:uncharacterized protein (DUF2147 family)